MPMMMMKRAPGETEREREMRKRIDAQAERPSVATDPLGKRPSMAW